MKGNGTNNSVVVVLVSFRLFLFFFSFFNSFVKMLMYASDKVSQICNEWRSDLENIILPMELTLKPRDS